MKVLSMILLLGLTTISFSATRTVSEITADSEFTTTTNSNTVELIEPPVTPEAPEVIWQYTQVSGITQKNCPIGQNADFVFTGGWYGGGIMFTGINGAGSALWETDEPTVGANEYWLWLGTGTVTAKTADIFYTVQEWTVYNDNGTPGDTSDDFLVSEGNTDVSLYSSASSIPIWSYSGTSDGFTSASVQEPGKYACSDDGTIFATAGAKDGHLAIQFFSSSSATPIATYEDASIEYFPRQIRLTADGTKCIFRVSANLYRVDIATGTLEDTFYLNASNDCFAISPDGSVVAYGFTAARIATWDGTEYSIVAGAAVSGFYGGAATIAHDNQTIYFGFNSSNYKTTRILRFDVSSSTPLWTYDSPTGTGSNQNAMQWMDCSDDGRWMVAGSWGIDNGGPEVLVFDDQNPEEPIFGIDTPGSMFHVDMSPDGQYITAAGKHVHANTMGSGTDAYFAEIDLLGIEGTESSDNINLLPINPNPVTNNLNVNFSLPTNGTISLGVYDLSGRLVQNLTQTQMATGSHNLSFTTDLNTGVYLCRLTSDQGSVTQKFVVAR